MTEETSTPRVFLARSGAYGEDEDPSLENGLIIIGFEDFPSLEGVADYEDVNTLAKAAYPELKPRALQNYAGQLWAFALSMKEGDIVALPRKTTPQVALGVVKGPYRYAEVGGRMRHTRAVEWVRPDVPRPAFSQDLLHSLGAFMTVCNIQRNDAARRIAAIMEGKKDPGASIGLPQPGLATEGSTPTLDDESSTNLEQLAHDQIVAHIQVRFHGHPLADLVNAVLVADGWVTTVSPPGPDGGVDILAGRGPLGLDSPRLCVQVKSQDSPADVNVYRSLQGAMQTFKADQALLVCWGGFNKAVVSEAKQAHFTMRLWDSSDLVNAIYETYDRLPAEIQAELPLKTVWTLVPDDAEV